MDLSYNHISCILTCSLYISSTETLKVYLDVTAVVSFDKWKSSSNAR